MTARSPVVTIYQNPDHVAGLVQQIFNAPLVTEETRDTDHASSSTETTAAGGNAGVTAKAKIFGVGEIGANLGGKADRDSASALSTSSKTSQSFVYSQAYYLNLVRNALQDNSLTQTISDMGDIEKLAPGDFVEFTADFVPPTIPSLMDVLTPELVAAITEWRVRKSGRDSIDFTDFDGIKAAAHEIDLKANADADLARGVASAFQADFRQESTREYYGSIKGLSEATIVTICDAQHFSVQDEDRILDGTYTVLGKVASTAAPDLPVFQRNKLLRNLSPNAADALVDSLLSSLKKSNNAVIGGQRIEELIDLNLSSRVPGTALRVIPIAIFL